MSIQRYAFEVRSKNGWRDATESVLSKPDGPFVRFGAHEAVVAEMQAEIDQLKGVNEVLMRERNFDPGAANVLSGFIAERNRWMTECDRLRALCEWRPISADDLPKVGEAILFVTNYPVEGNVEAGWFCFDEATPIFQCDRTGPQDTPIVYRLTDEQVSHWQPFPNAPVQP